MTTQTRTSARTERSFDETADRVRDINERVLTASRKAGQATVDSYERTLISFADLTEKAGGASQNEWVQAMSHAQADLTRDLTQAYASVARTLIKA